MSLWTADIHATVTLAVDIGRWAARPWLSSRGWRAVAW
ncbi:UNVERIFIED_ORG: hypothetical protein CLV66_12459 [Actinomadura viridilutea]